MKYLYLIAISIILTGCNFEIIEITGTATGMDGSTVSVKDKDGKIIYGENIEGGKFHIVQQPLKESGYYMLSVSTPGNRRSFEIYLEPGKYDIQLGADKKYPVITTSSETQNQLSQYYHFADSIRKSIVNENEQEKNKLNAKLDAAIKSHAPENVTKKLYEDLGIAEMKTLGMKKIILDKFADKFPNSSITTHILSNQDYESDPVKYYAIFKKLSKEAQGSKEGLKIEEKLGHLVNLQPGKIAPNIVGTTPDGKAFDLKATGKKIILVEFLRASTIRAREKHPEMIQILSRFSDKGLGIVSVSLDTDRDNWLTAIKNDKITWPQISDLKGVDSPNYTNWGIIQLPTYCLIDGQGKLVDWNVSFDEIQLIINDYLTKH